jgi:predicted negative regulator of RcsB-dependent stress response
MLGLKVVETIHADPSFSSNLPSIYGHFLEVHDQKQLAYSSYEKELKCCNAKPAQKTFAQVRL